LTKETASVYSRQEWGSGAGSLTAVFRSVNGRAGGRVAKRERRYRRAR